MATAGRVALSRCAKKGPQRYEQTDFTRPVEERGSTSSDDLRNLSALAGRVVVADVVHGPWLQHELGLALGQLGLQ